MNEDKIKKSKSFRVDADLSPLRAMHGTPISPTATIVLPSSTLRDQTICPRPKLLPELVIVEKQILLLVGGGDFPL